MRQPLPFFVFSFISAHLVTIVEDCNAFSVATISGTSWFGFQRGRRNFRPCRRRERYQPIFVPGQWDSTRINLFFSDARGESVGTDDLTDTDEYDVDVGGGGGGVEEEGGGEQASSVGDGGGGRRRSSIRSRVARLAKSMVIRPVVSAAPLPGAIAEILKDATVGAVDLAVEEVLSRQQESSRRSSSSYAPPQQQEEQEERRRQQSQPSSSQSQQEGEMDVSELVDSCFAPMEASLREMDGILAQARAGVGAAGAGRELDGATTLRQMDRALARCRLSLQESQAELTEAMEAIQAAAIAQAEGAVTAVAAAEEVATRKVISDIYDADAASDVDVSSLTYDDVGYHLSEMAPPYLDEDQCLIPGEAVVRVEKAPENSRRIFAGIDIPCSVESIWELLTNYENLDRVVPNLVVNEVLEEYSPKQLDDVTLDASLPDDELCQILSRQLKGAKLRQVGGAKVVGINFSARTTLEVREWPQGLPDFAHFEDVLYEGKTRDDRALDNTRTKLRRYRFPRPFALSSLPTRDISMQSVEDDNGEFRLYQGVWRLQPLPGCAPDGQDAMRLSYAVEISPRAYLPVSLVEGRIVRDLCANLAAIRSYVTSRGTEDEERPILTAVP